MQIRRSQRPKEIDHFEVVKTVKYLGIKLEERGRDIFREEKRWLKRAQTLATQLMAQIKKIYDKVTVGKAIWEHIMITALMFGKAVVIAEKTTINKVQSLVNRIYR